MKLPLHIICNAKSHCKTCRARKVAQAWREQLRESFDVPGNVRDFACPENKAWDDSWPLGQIPDDFDVEIERMRMRQGGCCGAPPMAS